MNIVCCSLIKKKKKKDALQSGPFIPFIKRFVNYCQKIHLLIYILEITPCGREVWLPALLFPCSALSCVRVRNHVFQCQDEIRSDTDAHIHAHSHSYINELNMRHTIPSKNSAWGYACMRALKWCFFVFEISVLSKQRRTSVCAQAFVLHRHRWRNQVYPAF